jgi:hypothetical protein
MPKSRPPYPEEFRPGSDGRFRPEGQRRGGVARVTEQSLRIWVKRDQFERRERDDGLTLAERDELRELRR